MKVPFVIWFITWMIGLSSQNKFINEPHLQTIDGHLYIYGAVGKNVSFMISPDGYLNINGDDLHKVVKDAKLASSMVFANKQNSLSRLEESLKTVAVSIEEVSQRLNTCETFIKNYKSNDNKPGISTLYQWKIKRLERKVRQIIRNLSKQECLKDPCLNGGTCQNRYLGYECRCPEGWEGKQCEKDVNECAKFAGTDLGCQNKATCVNKPGTYECICQSGWYGLHCTKKSNDCSSGSNSELCGHGVCISGGPKGFICICEQGWKSNGVHPACTVDVDECSMHSPCSKTPLVTCHNVPGSFFCGPCPLGYTGNGMVCTDINECLEDNGGCSTQPFVQCINTQGSSTCGPCPPGYIGDGKSCTFVGKCQVDNGGCHPSARCQEIGSQVQCQCGPGLTGTGIGPHGCYYMLNYPTSIPCTSNPCENQGTCQAINATDFTCICLPGYIGKTCQISRLACLSNPCQNGGTCYAAENAYICKCPYSYIGRRCQQERSSCNDRMNSDEGELQYPPANSTITTEERNVNCAWLINVDSSLVVNLTFESFDMGISCFFDSVQIHDGRRESDHSLGIFCGNQLPNNGTIISSGPSLLIRLKTHNTRRKKGFKLKWKAAPPVCGGPVDAKIHGVIKSPGSPGKYPHNRDCYWEVTAPYGKRISFTFFEVYLESHENCSYDYLAIHESLSPNSLLLAKYCNTTTPQPLVTPGNAALVHFHSDEFYSDRGFQIAYNPVPGHPGCGGIFTDVKGEIYPPTENNYYYKNMDCAWLIRLPQNLRIEIRFAMFDLESHDLCLFDSVEIREGSDVKSPLIGRYCGTEIPPVIASEGNELFVRFISDNSGQSKGFRLQYSSICRRIFTGETGVITSLGYPSLYRNAETCVFIIEQPPKKAIILQFQDFDMEAFIWCTYDYLEIRDGHNEDSPLIGKYCGTKIPPTIISSHNYLYLKMATDSEIAGRGFLANYSVVDIYCGGILTAPHGIIRDPKSDDLPHTSNTCRWVISGQTGQFIRLTFLSFLLNGRSNCSSDYIEIYDNNTFIKQTGRIGRYCGYDMPPILTSTDYIMTIIYKFSDSNFRNSFSISYDILNGTTACGGNYFTSSGTIKSPNYPNRYPPSRTCIWTIKIPNGNKIVLNALNFSLDNFVHNCEKDYLEIRDGSTETSHLIGRYCGTKIPSRIVSQSNNLHLKFKSETVLSHSSSGFRIFWDGSLSGCGGTISGISGTIMSPNYPEPYGANLVCIYKISTSLGSKVELSIIDLELESSQKACIADYLEFFDGFDGSAKSLGKYCNMLNELPVMMSTSNQMLVKFKSNSEVFGKGFHLKYRTVCNTQVTGFRGVIESPNFPNGFPPSMNCTWIITAPKGNKVNLSFSDFDLYNFCKDTFIKISEGNILPTNTIGKYCNDKKPSLIASSLDKVFVDFVSSANSLRMPENFRIEWVVNGCGGIYSKPSGTLTSPNYPNFYPPDTVCEYYINVDSSYSIDLSITDMNFENLKGCFGDYLEIYAGHDRTGPLINKICEKSGKIDIKTSSNQLYLVFNSDMITPGTGFLAHYSTKPSQCGGRQVSTAMSRITSRFYPKNYMALDNCVWELEVPSNSRISLTFEDFDLTANANCSSTYVEIFDGPSESYPSLLKHCGNALPTPNRILSSSNKLTVRMRTGNEFPAKGFQAVFYATCGATIIANTPGVIVPYDTVDTLSHSYNCSWTIISPEPDGHITLTVSVYLFHESHYCDVLYAYDGDSHNSTLIQSFCKRKTYLPIVSRGNVLFLEQDGSAAYYNFKAVYSSLTSECGGDLSGETGSFASPSYPGSYPTNSECIWTLSAGPGNQYQVSFRNFDLGVSENCDEEYIEIRDKDAVGKIQGVFCGDTVPDNLTATNKFWIKFKSSKTATGKKGFLADFNIVYENEINGTQGLIGNPFYPSRFLHDKQNIYWRISVAFGSVIRIKFVEVYLNDLYEIQCHTSVKVFDGFDSTAPLLTKVCGLNIPESVTSSSNVVYISFNSFYQHHGSLFLLKWEKVSKWSHTVQEQPAYTSGCGGRILLDKAGNKSVTLKNQDWPGYSSAELNCEWIIECNDYDHLVLNVNELLLRPSYGSGSVCDFSYLAVSKRAADSDWVQIRKYCLSNETNQVVHGSNYMKVVVKAPVYFYSIFSFTVTIECGNSIKKPNGALKFHWRDYLINETFSNEEHICQWDITVNSGKKIQAEFTEFDFATNENICSSKYLLLRNGGLEDSPFLGKGVFCKFPYNIPQTTSNRLFVKVFIPKMSHLQNFRLVFEEISPSCGRRVNLDDAMYRTLISSPNYPQIPPSKIECIWTFSTEPGREIQIDFLERFDLEETKDCSVEYVEVFDGGTELSEVIGRFCSGKPSSLKSTGNMLILKYYTNSTNPRNGFKAQVSIARCGGVIKDREGILTSPDYPSSYLYGIDCKWEIETTAGYKLRVTFIDVDFPLMVNSTNSTGVDRVLNIPMWQENSYRIQANCTTSAYISVGEQRLVATNFIWRSFSTGWTQFLKKMSRNKYHFLMNVCDNSQRGSVTSATNKINIVYKSSPESRKTDGRIPRGFKLSFASIGHACSFQLNTASGIIKSPGYPTLSASQHFCKWDITVPKGRRITLEVLDLDLSRNPNEQRVFIFEEIDYLNPIVLLNMTSEILPQYKSSSNHMGITFESLATYIGGDRGFKLSYNSDEPQVCGGELESANGILTPPNNLTMYSCKWEFNQVNNKTIAFYLIHSTIGNNTIFCDWSSGSEPTFTFSGKGDAWNKFYSFSLCGHAPSMIIRSPFLENYFSVIKRPSLKFLNFTVLYKVNDCGGMINGPEVTITSPTHSGSNPQQIDCAWLISFPNREKIKLTFLEFSLQPSCQDFVSIKNGHSMKSPLIGEYCGTSLPSTGPIISQSSDIFLEFHSNDLSVIKGFKILAETASGVCGGYINTAHYILTTPNYPSSYDNDQECEWIIKSTAGTRITLEFIDRFHIESSENCQNDFVHVYDFINEEWKLLKSLCGRELPSAITSTSNKLKVLFRSNNAVVSDGFKAVWNETCGSTFYNIDSGTISSPNYPHLTTKLLHCVYIIDHNELFTTFEFTDLSLEGRSKGSCASDYLKIYENNYGTEYLEVGTYCGNEKPQPKTLLGKTKLEFHKDRLSGGRGFMLKFHVLKCGGLVRESKIIGISTNTTDYSKPSLRCKWKIIAPENHTIVLRFYEVNVFAYEYCGMSSLQLVETLPNGTDDESRICGSYKSGELVFKSKTSNLTVSASPSHMIFNFSALVLFTHGGRSDCDKIITLDSDTEVKSPDFNNDGYYEEYLDCSWVIRGKPNHLIEATFTAFDVQTCNIENLTDPCICDYVELRDDIHFHSDILLHTCGKNLPPPVVSSTNEMLLRFQTDGTYNGKGFTVKFSNKPTPCGDLVLTAKEKIQVLTSPNYPSAHPEGLRCSWKIYDSEENKRVHVHIVDYSIKQSDQCNSDYLSIEDSASRSLRHFTTENYINNVLLRNKTSESTALFRGKSMYKSNQNFQGSVGRVKFCGNGGSANFFSQGDEVTVKLVTTGSTGRGFKIEYSFTGCNRNYTGNNGETIQVSLTSKTHCYVTITAPSANHTVSLFFSSFRIWGSSEDCNDDYLEVHDGPDVKSKLLGKFCGYSLPSPVFSSGQYLWIHAYLTHDYNPPPHADITYTFSDQGKGCGGRIQATYGVLASPGYPSNVRKNSVCRWDIIVPADSEIYVEITYFDLGPSNTCSSDYLEFFDLNTKTDILTSRARYCGGDTPNPVRSSPDVLVIKYTTSLHNGGLGWSLKFRSAEPGVVYSN